MLVLSRQQGESIRVDGAAIITVMRVKGKRVALAIEAEGTVNILRTELEKDKQNGGKYEK